MTDHTFPVDDVSRAVERALDEDLGPTPGVDVTTLATIPAAAETDSRVVARSDGVVAGLPVLALVFDAVARRLATGRVSVSLQAADGDVVARGTTLATLEGSTSTTLVGERTALNLLCRASGVATHTRLWASALSGTGATVLDTRKTTPGLRALEKYAVRCGGGANKRMGLYDVAMV
ncbi:MAG: L-aspartate oxidase, partial [Phycicoccus sp.]